MDEGFRQAKHQFVAMIPGIVAGLAGDPAAGAALLQGVQDGQQMADEQRRQKQIDSFAVEDRNREIERQRVADQRATQDQEWQNTQRTITLANTLNSAADSAETVPGAESSIDSIYGLLPPELRTRVAPARDAALRGAVVKVTGRQKAELRRWVTDQLLPSQFVDGYKDADPDITQAMPARIRQFAEALTGKQQFKKSDLLALTETLEPAKRPSDDVSLQRDTMLVNGVPTAVVFNPKTAEWKNQSGNVVQVSPIPQRQGGGDELNANQQALLTERLAKSWNDANASGREMRRQLGLMQTGLRRFREGDKNGGSQAVLVTFQKILDPTSVVRESEYARSAQGISMLARIQGYMERLEAGGAGVPDAELAGMVETARQMLDDMQSYSSGQRSRIEAVAKKHRIDPIMIFGMEPARSGGGLPSDALPPMAPVSSRGPMRLPGNQNTTTAGAPKLKERRRFGDVLGEWDGEKWIEVKF